MAPGKRERFSQLFRRAGKPGGNAPSKLPQAAASTSQSQRQPIASHEESSALVSLSHGATKPGVVPVAAMPRTLWQRAYDVVAASDAEILRPFEQMLSAQNDSFRDVDQLKLALAGRLQRRDDARLAVSFAGKSLVVRQQGEKLIKFVIWSKDFIGSAVSTEPHAALAWTGVSLLLPVRHPVLSFFGLLRCILPRLCPNIDQLVLRSTEQNSAMMDGLGKITDLLSLYEIRVESYYARGIHSQALEDDIIQIFAKIIEYQARCIRHLNRGAFGRLGSNIIISDDWGQSLRAILDRDQHVNTMTGILDKQFEDAALRAQFRGLSTQSGLNKEMLRVLDELRQQQYDTQIDENMKRCLQALSSPYREGKDFNRERVPNTCEWFLKSDALAEWRCKDGPSALWLSADPGCGKSVMARCLVDGGYLSSTTFGSVCCYFFFKEGLAGRQTMADALTAVLHQLFCAQPTLIKYAMQAYNQHGPELRQRSLDLWDILVAAAEDCTAGEIVVLLDALDESEPAECSRLLEATSRMIHQPTEHSFTNLKFFMTSRPYTRIEGSMAAMHDCATFIRVPGEDELEAIGQEIDLVIVEDIPNRLSTLTRSQCQHTISLLKSKQNRTYLWLYLVIDVIKSQVATVVTNDALDDLINNLPENAQAAYSTILQRSPSREKARTLLQLVYAARRPLEVGELMCLLMCSPWKDGVNLRSLSYEVQHQDFEIAKSNLKNICGLLLAVSHGKVYFLHETVREYLVGDNEQPLAEYTWHHFDARVADSTIGKACIITLNLIDELVPAERFLTTYTRTYRLEYTEKSFLKLMKQTGVPPSLLSIFDYATKQWHRHAESISREEYALIFPLASNLCQLKRASCICWLYDDMGFLYAFTPMTLAAIAGQQVILEALIENGADVNGPTQYDDESLDRRDSYYGSGFCAAVARGRIEAAKMLLKAGANVNEVRGMIGTARLLISAIKRGEDDLVHLLIENGADIDCQGWRGLSALAIAAQNGLVLEVRCCLALGAKDYESALSAAESANEAGVEAIKEAGHDKLIKHKLANYKTIVSLINAAAIEDNLSDMLTGDSDHETRRLQQFYRLRRLAHVRT